MQAVSIKGHSKIVISCWHTISYVRVGGMRQHILWSSAQEQELFAYLLHHRGRAVDITAIAGLLRPDGRGRGTDEAEGVVSQLRRTLGRHGLHELAVRDAGPDAGCMLVLGDAAVEADEWEARMNGLGEPTVDTAPRHEQALAAYTGDYLAMPAYIWADAERSRLRELWRVRAAKLSDHYMRHGAARLALRLNHRIQQLHPYADDSYFTLMKLYDERGDRSAADKQYELLCARWRERYGCSPDARITSWYTQRGAAPTARHLNLNV